MKGNTSTVIVNSRKCGRQNGPIGGEAWTEKGDGQETSELISVQAAVVAIKLRLVGELFNRILRDCHSGPHHSPTTLPVLCFPPPPVPPRQKKIFPSCSSNIPVFWTESVASRHSNSTIPFAVSQSILYSFRLSQVRTGSCFI